MERNRIRAIGSMALVLLGFALALWCIKHVIFLWVERTDFTDRMASMAGMTVMTGCLCMNKRIRLSVLPERWTIGYVCASLLFAVLLLASPSNFQGDMKSPLLLIYSCIVTLVFEELLFRGYLWNRLKPLWKNEWLVFIAVTLLFGLWHLAYTDAIAFRVAQGVPKVMFWKVVTGLCYGCVLGAVRIKAHNCYATILLHGAMNLFGR